MNSTNQLPQFHHAGRFAGQHDVGMHSHPGSEFVLVMEGRCSVDMAGQTFTGGPGTLFIVPSGVTHNQREHEYTRTHYVVFTAGPRVFDDAARALSLDLTSERWVTRWVDDLCSLSESPVTSAGTLAAGLLHALLERTKQIEGERRSSRSMHPALVRALALIDRDPSAVPSVATLARHAAVSPSYLTALFEKSLGHGPMQHVQEVRLARAKRLLGDPYLSVKEVGRMCGYENPNYFSRLFGRKVGQTPGEFRRRTVAVR